MGSKKLNENYTDFGTASTPGWLSPEGGLGRFFARFFGNKTKAVIARGDDLSTSSVKLIPADAGDTVLDPDQVLGPGIGYNRNGFMVVSQKEIQRKYRYKEYEEMDEYPEIGAAFDIYADECTQKGARGEKWYIQSNSEIIKETVETLFGTIKLENFYWDISRNTVKYGDCFIETVVDLNNPLAGIQKIKVLNPNYILRIENEWGYLEAFLQEIPEKNDWSSFGAQADSMHRNKFIKLDKEQMVHFRLHTSNPYYYPYGKSIAASARRVFRSLMMMEDAMLVYRLNRAPERRVFYINVQGLPPAKAKAYIEEFQRTLKKKKFYDRSANQVDEKFDPVDVTEDYVVPIKGSNDGTKIENLEGAANLGEVDDVKYFRDKLLALLKIPKDFLVEKDKSPERKANLSQLDVKFARTIARVQQQVQLGLEEIAKRHLQLKGFPEHDIAALKIYLPEPSDLYTKRKLDVEEQKARTVKAVQGLGIFSKKYVYQYFYDMSDAQIDKIQKELEADIELESQGILPSVNPMGGGMEEEMMGMPGESQDAEQGETESGGDSAENKPPTSESITNILRNSPKLNGAGNRIAIALARRIINEDRNFRKK